MPLLLPAFLFVIPQGSAVVVAFAVAVTLTRPPKTTSSRPKAAHFAAAVERPLYFALAVCI
jgi:hypothetical protein